jgi:peptidoglycan/LPS O-acetylase OafA/YrhL
LANPANEKQEFYGIQALRAIAALAVVAGHSNDYLQMQNGFIPPALQWIHGPAGVDIFFVISGFVMTISAGRLLAKRNPAQIFLWRRMLRIVPLYWMLTLLKLILITVSPSFSVHAMPSHWNILSSFLFIPARNPAGEIRPLIPVGWTLSFEMLFYALFALSLAACKPRKPGQSGKETLWFLAPAIGSIAVLGVFRTGRWPDWTALADPMALEFLGGVLLARLTLQGHFPRPWLAAVLLLAGIAGLVLWLPAGEDRALVWGVPAAAIVCGTVALESLLRGRLPAWLLLLGDASYAIYLIQTFVFPVVHRVAGRFFFLESMVHSRPVVAGIVMTAVSLPFVSAAGVAVHLSIERRMTNYLKGLFGVERISPVAR